MMTKEEILNAAKKWEDFCIALRRDFHESPELSGQETQTIARICTELRAVGLSPIEVQDGGVLAVIEGDAPGKTVLLRADVDALPVQEDPCNLLRKKECVSKIPGVSHVCGHDCHADVYKRQVWRNSKEQSMRNLFVIGNRFDLAHNIKRDSTILETT